MNIYISFGQLESYLALKPVKDLLAETGAAIDFIPMLGSLGNVVSKAPAGQEDPLAEYKERRARARHRATGRERQRMVEMLGITGEAAAREIDPLFLCLGLTWVADRYGDQLVYVDRAFAATYVEGSDVESVESVTRLIEESGVSADGFDEYVEAQSESFTSSVDRLLEEGLLSAPAFVVDGEIFHGREHLPLIRWMLNGREGVPPV